VSKVLLIYPYFRPPRDRSVFRFPPLGVSYLASSLLDAGYDVQLLDCTFMDKSEALLKAQAVEPEVVGIYCMVTMLEDCLWFARQLRASARLLMVGGPLPTCDPQAFLSDFDVVVRGEGEGTLLEILKAYATGRDFSTVPGIALRRKTSTDTMGLDETIFTPERAFTEDLDKIGRASCRERV
jgi:anaerobic magnesium-protoporphyrin IX monomethyl ester cyclase